MSSTEIKNMAMAMALGAAGALLLAVFSTWYRAGLVTGFKKQSEIV